MRRIALAVLILAAGAANAADPDKGAQIAAGCAVCHGLDGVSVTAEIPNLAAQKADYLQAQLRAFRAGDRENPLMNAVAAQLEDAQIEDVAAYFSGLDGAAPGASSDLILAATKPRFPSEYEEAFTRYDTIDFPERGQVRHFYANDAALKAAREGGDFADGAYLLVEIYSAVTDESGAPVEGDDGRFQEGELAAFTAMEKAEGWGAEVPEIIRNDNWRYAVFTPEGEHREVNEGGCLACHKPLDDTDYSFTYEALAAFAADEE